MTNISDGEAVCPNCRADLGALRRIRGLAASYYNQGLQAARAGSYEAAERSLHTAIGLDEGLARARVLLGKLLWRQGRREEAEREWQEATAASPGDESIVELLAQAQAANRAARRTIGGPWAGRLRAWAIVVVAAAVFLLAGLYLRGLSHHMDELEAYRSAHGVSDMEHNRVLEAFNAQMQEAQVAQTELQEYRRMHTVLDSEHASLRQVLEDKRAEAEALRQSLAAYMTSHSHDNEAYQRVVTMAAREAEQRRSLEAELDMLRGQRPPVPSLPYYWFLPPSVGDESSGAANETESQPGGRSDYE